ncbi:hypothetical protein CPB83DRAFT_855639 [Crepidotus variabilis]|uniref:F-box domain-containing protein n=1 Tax=Crepidotus variabilis TaxID=179855 RepID=A0A9P6EEV4_9AGAR|nr:hypothetical protein CPB83DRAFT_855639 [Crepidotus variabilis]
MLLIRNCSPHQACSLPAELYLRILTYLDYRSLLKCAQVCTTFNEFVSNTTSLQYTIELAVAGQLDNMDCPLAASEKLTQLKKHQKAWRDVKWSREYEIKMSDGDFWELYGGVLGVSTARNTFIFHCLASDLRNIQETTWEIEPDPKIPIIRDFTMDPSQDLFVILEIPNWFIQQEHYNIHIHFRSLTNGKNHPKACEGRKVTHRFDESTPEVWFDMQVFGHLILVFMAGATCPEVFIWNWQTGDLLCNLYGDDICTSALLSDEWLVVGITDEYGPPSIVTVNFLREGTSRCQFDELDTKGSFSYPSFAGKSWFNGIQIRCDPGPLWNLQPRPSSAFYTDPKEFVFVVSLGIGWGRSGRHTYNCTHIISSSYLLSLAESSANEERPWNTWAAKRTQFFLPRCIHSDVWVCFVSGKKHVFAAIPKAGQFSAVLVDINQLPLRRMDEEKKSYLDDDAVKPKDFLRKLFDEPVETSMSFMSNTMSLEDSHPHSEVLCSEDNIIIVDVLCGNYRVLVF